MINFYAINVIGSEPRGSGPNAVERRDDCGVEQTRKDPSLPARLEGQDGDRAHRSVGRQQRIHLPGLLLNGLRRAQENLNRKRRVVARLYSRRHVAATRSR